MMEIKCREEIVQNIEKLINLSNKAILHLESLNRNVPHELSIREKREYSNKIYDDIELFDRFKQNTTILLNEALTLPQAEINAVTKAKSEEPTKSEKMASASYNDQYAFTSIDKIVFCGKEYQVRNWADTLITVCELVVKDLNLKPSDLVDNENLRGKKRNYFSLDPKALKRAQPISNGCYLELNFSARDIYKISHLLMNEMGYKESDLEILFCKKNSTIADDEEVDIDISEDDFKLDFFDDPIKMLKEIEKQFQAVAIKFFFQTKKSI